MQSRTSQGNVVLEFLVYVLIVMTFLLVFIDFFKLVRNLNEANKLANSLSVAISLDLKSISYWNLAITQNEIMQKVNLDQFRYLISCRPVMCSLRPETVEVKVIGNNFILGIKIPVSVTKVSSVSRFLSK